MLQWRKYLSWSQLRFKPLLQPFQPPESLFLFGRRGNSGTCEGVTISSTTDTKFMGSVGMLQIPFLGSEVFSRWCQTSEGNWLRD